jgi:drug/metabolite transporter (DMT)-like permease
VSGAELAGGLALAAAAAACFDGAVALQALEARALPTDTVGPGLVRGLLRRPRWLAATALAIAGWPLQVAALTLAPLTVVQPTLAVGLVLLLALGVHLLGEPAGPRDLLACAAIAAGLALLAWAAPERSTAPAGSAALVAVLGALGLVTLAPWVLRHRLRGDVMVLAAGCGYAASGLTSKLLADALGSGHLGTVAGWALVTAAVAALALGDEMGALQRVGAARVAAGAFALQIVVPVLGAPVLTGESWSATPLHGAVIVGGMVLVVAGTLALGTGAAVSGLLTASHGSHS